MFAYVEGRVAEKSPTRVVIDVQGLGYELNISVNTYERVPPVGQNVRLFTYLYVREEIMQLYGFSDTEERDLFLQLISVSGVGPKMAQGILSKVTVEDFTRAVANNDYLSLTQIPGVGKKTAQRLIMELKDRLLPGKVEAELGTGPSPALAEEAVLALISLGYRRTEAEKLVRKVFQSGERPNSVELLIKKALQSAA